MTKKLSKSSKQILSVLFHLVVLGCMVILYDAGKLLVGKLGWINVSDEVGDASGANFMEHEELLKTEIDPKLLKLVDKDATGYLFGQTRSFPPHLKVIVTDITKFDKVRIAQKIGATSVRSELTARIDDVMEYEMAGKAVRFTKVQDLNQRQPSLEERMKKTKAAEDAKEKGKAAPEDEDHVVGQLVGKIVQFNYDGINWKAVPTGEFKTMAWAKSLEDDVNEILVANGLKPKPRWFGAKRLPIGHKVNLSGKSLDIIFDNAASGSINMEFVAVEGVHGHPCAVFDVSGSIKLKNSTDAEGRSKSGEETIDSGKIWFSLLYPVVMRTKLNLIVSHDTRDGGKLVEQFQGKSTKHVHFDWKTVTAQPKERTKPAPKK